jgi:hypothetical protein
MRIANLPEFKFSGNFQLVKSKIQLQAFRRRKIRSVWLVPIFDKISQMVSYDSTESSKFSFSFILLTKLESSMSSLLHMAIESIKSLT